MNAPTVVAHQHQYFVTQASDLVNPAPKTLYQQKLLNQQENIYHTHQKAPLGRLNTMHVVLFPPLLVNPSPILGPPVPSSLHLPYRWPPFPHSTFLTTNLSPSLLQALLTIRQQVYHQTWTMETPHLVVRW